MAKRLKNIYINEHENAEYGKILMDGQAKTKKSGAKKGEAKPMPLPWKVLRPITIIAISLVIVLVCTNILYSCVEGKYFAPVDANSSELKEVTIEKSSSLSAIANTLYENGIIRNPTVFKLYADFSDMSYKLKAGTYELSPGMDFDDIIYTLIKGEAESPEITLTFIEGATVEQEASLLADSENGILDSKDRFLELCRSGNDFASYDFIQAVIDQADARDYNLEGYLFPDTYRVYSDASEEEVIAKQLTRFDEIFTDEYRARAEELGMSIDETVILASIIEKEAKTTDFKKVSAVFHNRLNANMPLGSCATMQKVTGEAKYTFTDEELAIDSPYNTYLHTGLPVGPICNPGKDAIEAALYPDEEYITEGYYYFCLTTPESGEQVFAKTYEEHLQNQAEWSQYW